MLRSQINNSVGMLYHKLLENQSQCSFALLLDPEKLNVSKVNELCTRALAFGVDTILLGGSLVSTDVSEIAKNIKSNSSLPLILFPGSALQYTPHVDAMLFLTLISGRNPEFLIGNHIQVAMRIKGGQVEIIPTGYILIDGGVTTSVQYISNTKPIPANKPDIAVATAVAGELLGLKVIYLEAGSGAQSPVPPAIIEKVRANVSIPLIVGGGLRSPQQLRDAKNAGASMVVVGTAAEENPYQLELLVAAIKK